MYTNGIDTHCLCGTLCCWFGGFFARPSHASYVLPSKEINANAKYPVAAQVRVSPSGPCEIGAAARDTASACIVEREDSELDTE